VEKKGKKRKSKGYRSRGFNLCGGTGHIERPAMPPLLLFHNQQKKGRRQRKETGGKREQANIHIPPIVQ